jgi:Cu(I)/Ag(I) efflux system membrane fusion protein/cobalt-zinc-cadmium efflux system membrane fusion protein
MYATARIDGTTTDEAVLVPREAVIDTGRRQLVFVALADGKFEPRDVAVGATGDDGQVQILRGVAAAEQVVTSGQFLLDAESRTQEAIQKYLAERRPAARP